MNGCKVDKNKTRIAQFVSHFLLFRKQKTFLEAKTKIINGFSIEWPFKSNLIIKYLTVSRHLLSFHLALKTFLGKNNNGEKQSS